MEIRKTTIAFKLLGAITCFMLLAPTTYAENQEGLQCLSEGNQCEMHKLKANQCCPGLICGKVKGLAYTACHNVKETPSEQE